MKYKIHPVATAFPMMSKAEFDALKEDIRVNGQREPIVFWKNMLVDGRNRLKACEELGIKPDESELMDETDPIAWVISHNLHRRHLSESQRAMVAAELAKMTHGGDRKKDQESNCTLEKVSSMLKVSKDSIKRAKKVLASGADEVKRAVDQGELPVSVAAEFVKQVPDKQDQAEIVKKGKEEIRRVLKKPPQKGIVKEKPIANKSVCEKCSKLKIELETAKAEIDKLKALLDLREKEIESLRLTTEEKPKRAPKPKPKHWVEPGEIVATFKEASK